jgi:uncharacterized protein with PQ loop repeat
VSTATTLGLAAALINGAVVAPQAWRSMTSPDRSGVNLSGYLASLVSALTWRLSR